MSARRSPLVDGTVLGVRVSRYDLYLALLPVPLLLGAVGALATAAPPAYGAGVGALCASPLLAYSLFYDAPTGGSDHSGHGGHGGRDGRGAVPADD